jgi:2-polyprenyl-3-methyl-5-hydroxy-6-metoxy-1,4-benzoquinol methylase
MIRNRMRRKELYSTAAYWDSKAAAYDDDAVSWWPNNHLNTCYHAEQIALFESFLPDVRGRTILDLGCGTGRISRYLADRGAVVHGIDFSAKAVAIAKQRSPGPNPSFETRSVFDLDAEQAYDNIAVFGVVTIACKDRRELLDVMRRIRRALKPKGALMMIEPVHRSFLHRVLKMGLREFLGVVEEAGFRVVKTRQLHFWPARLSLAFLPWPRRFTRLGYRVGQSIMAVAGYQAGGDYKALYATLR